MKNLAIALFFILAISACQPEEEEEIKTFHCPVLISETIPDTLRKVLFEVDEIMPVFPRFMGKHKFCDTLLVYSALRLFSNDEKLHENKYVSVLDSFDINGFELIVDYENTIYGPRRWYEDSVAYGFYPVYFVNSTSTDKLFLGKDSYVFGIQEAVNRFNYNQWQPIEYRGFDFCGNGRWGLVVHPGEFILILMQKYAGEVKTILRNRFRVGETTYVSKPFLGFVNPEQFSMKDSSYIWCRMRESNGNAAEWLFYGATIEDEEWAVKAF